jgi:hypothetical protein
MKQWIRNAKEVKEAFSSIKDIAEDLQAGDIISDEDYATLVKLNPEIEKYFIQTAGGMQALTSGSVLAPILKSRYANLPQLKALYENASEAGKKNKNSGRAGLELQTSDDLKTFFNSLDADSAGTLYDFVEGGDKTRVQNSLDIINDPNADTSSDEYKAAFEYLQKIGLRVNDVILQSVEGGLTSKDAQELWATSYATSFAEVQEEAQKGNIDQDVLAKAEKSWKNTYLAELGLALSDDVRDSLDMSDLQEQAEKARKLELDYLQDITREIERIDTAIEAAFGEDKLKLFEEKGAALTEGMSQSQLIASDAKGVFNYKATSAGLDQYIQSDGQLNVAAFLNYIAGIEDKESSEYVTAQEILASYYTWQDKEAENLDYQNQILDLQIEAYDYMVTTFRDFSKTIQEWRTSIVDFQKFSKGGLAAFAELNPIESIGSALTLLNQNGGSLQNTFNQIMGEVSNFQSWMSGGGADNPFKKIIINLNEK